MPASQPFTALCQATARPRTHGRADLHLHTTASDGDYTPEQLVELGRRSGLAAIALTDHDTMAGISRAVQAAQGTNLEVIAGVEMSCELNGKEVHLLGYFIDSAESKLPEALQHLAERRRERFKEMTERLKAVGVPIDEDCLTTCTDHTSPGRRHLAEAIVRAGRAGTVRQAFARYLSDHGRVAVPKACLAVDQALQLVRAAGGVASWAHPSYDCCVESVRALSDRGLGALEAVYPTHRHSRAGELRALAKRFDLAVSGGSDCHGPENPRRSVGAASISAEELEQLRQRKFC